MNAPRVDPLHMARAGLCIGCGACVGQSAGSEAWMRFDGHGLLRPHGSPAWLRRGPEHFARTCPFSPRAPDEDALARSLFADAPVHDAASGRFVAAWVGHVADVEMHAQGSSGGLTSWLAIELLRRGWIDAVAHVHPADPQRDGRYFEYRLSRSVEEVRAGAKSRYYPVELSEVLQRMFAAPGRYAVVGIPCFIKAVQLLRRAHPVLRERIRYTLGLFCGHMKSARFVESLAWQLGVSIDEVRSVEFRRKQPGRPANWYNAALTLHDGRVLDRDWWHLADGDWGAGFFMDAACNFCDDVTAETADVAFGDAWVEPYASDWRGHNVVIARRPDIAALLEEAARTGRIVLQAVDAGFVARTQAAGLRQRREGLAYRLALRGRDPLLGKRVAPDAGSPRLRRRLIYRMRRAISAWSHRSFLLARRTRVRGLYLRWARGVLRVYHALAYHRGPLGRIAQRIGLR